MTSRENERSNVGKKKNVEKDVRTILRRLNCKVEGAPGNQAP